jgi:serine/threonine protein kinase
MDDRKNDRFGRYEILSELGRGAMGIVYKARDPKINRVVALKTISLRGQPPEEELEFRQRFIREAEAAGRLSHPGIVTIFDVGEEPETRAPYIVMEYVGGQSLDKCLSSQVDHKLPLDTALQLIIELAEALESAHGQGVVHRDLKPANVLLTPDGKAKIADFGVAKLNLGNTTLAGRAFGTPAFMSPEQLNGLSVDGRSDLFSLGVMLYTIVTGHRPFQGNSAITISYKVVNHEPVPATVLNAQLPQGVDSVILRATAKDPAQRYQSATEMVFDVQNLREGLVSWGKVKQPSPTRASAPARPKLAVGASDTREKIRQVRALTRRTLVAGGFFLVAALAYGIWAISFGPKGVQRRLTVAPLLAQVSRAPVSRKEPSTPLAGVASSPPVSNMPSPVGASPTRDGAEPTVQAPDVPAPSPRMSVAPMPHKTLPTKELTSVEESATLNSSAASVTASPAISPAMLEIEVDHKFAEAKLSVWVDDHLTYTHQLEGVDKKRLVVFHHVQGHELHAMQIAPGTHRLRVRVTSDAAGYDQSATVTGEFASKHDNIVEVTFDKHGDMNLSLH